MQSKAHVSTTRAVIYLGQLRAHFQHKIPTEYTKDGTDKASGRIEFPMGTCTLEAEGGTLILRADAADEAALAQLQDVVARHLDRFAFRDKPAIDWRAVEAAE